MIAVGVLGKPHGVRGEIGLRLFNSEGAGDEDAPVGWGRSFWRATAAPSPT